MTSQDQTLVMEEVQATFRKEAVVKLSKSERNRGFYSSLFLVPKKAGALRSVINLKPLNKFVSLVHFKMEGMHTQKDILRKNDWLTKVDLKYTFLHDSITERRQENTTLLRPRSPVPAYMSTIRPVVRSIGLY